LTATKNVLSRSKTKVV